MRPFHEWLSAQENSIEDTSTIHKDSKGNIIEPGKKDNMTIAKFRKEAFDYAQSQVSIIDKQWTVFVFMGLYRDYLVGIDQQRKFETIESGDSSLEWFKQFKKWIEDSV